MSGLSRTPGKRVRGKTLRGFESRPLRQQRLPNAESDGHRAPFIHVNGAFFLPRVSCFGRNRLANGYRDETVSLSTTCTLATLYCHKGQVTMLQTYTTNWKKDDRDRRRSPARAC